MIDHVWTVACSRAIIDRDSNNVSILNVLEQFNIAGSPGPDRKLDARVELISLWARSDFAVPSHGEGRLTLNTPAGKQIARHEFTIDLAQFRRFRARGVFAGIPIPEPGRYVFEVEARVDGEEEWHLVASVPVEVLYEFPEGEPESGEDE
jgi:hypothetical protein